MPVVMLLVTVFAPKVEAASFVDQINQLKTKNIAIAEDKQELSQEAKTLSQTIAELQTEIGTLDSQIGDTTKKVDELKTDIAKSEKELAEQRTLLSLNVRKMYAEQDISTIEMLASSKNFSHFVDQEAYRSELQEKINSTTDRIKKLNEQLQNEKRTAENLLTDQKQMQKHLNDRRAESNRLLGLNQQQQAAFQASINENAEKIAQLQREQAAENKKGEVIEPPAPQPTAPAPAPVKAVSGADYPWPNVPFPNTMVDPWGMYKRQCVSYTAWRVAASGRHMPYWGGRGNAKNWDDNARAAGIPVDHNPRVGDVAISNAGTYGHAMYVEAVHGDGTITVSQYNADWKGNYSVVRRSTANLVFIHF